MPKTGDVNRLFGIYKTTCCSFEIVVVKGAKFPVCPKHKVTATWKRLADIEPPQSSRRAA